MCIPQKQLPSPGHYRRGFTLTELMIAIALVLLLMVGVTKVFQLTSDTIGAGMAISSITRDQRAAQNVFERDFEGLANNHPALAIWGQQTPGYLDRAALDNDPTNAAPEIFRTDRLGMFITGDFQRQTANDGSLASSVSSQQAYVWYGHLVLPDAGGNMMFQPANTVPITPGAIITGGDFRNPGNPNNYFARQWVLGRNVMLLKQKVLPTTGTPPISVFQVSSTGIEVEQAYIDDTGANDRVGFTKTSAAGGADTTPLATRPRLQQSRYDLIGMDSVSADCFPRVATKLLAPGNWWDDFDFRFQADPFPVRPLTSAAAAKTTPQFLAGCTSFIVEFAGEYDATPGLDYDDIDPDGPGAGTLPQIRRTRWYGFPRDVNGDGNINENDVAPVGWHLGSTQAFERDDNGNAFPNKPGSYPGGTTAAPYPTLLKYVTAWTVDPATWPKLIRITYTVQDPNGRLANPQPVEMIFRVKQAS